MFRKIIETIKSVLLPSRKLLNTAENNIQIIDGFETNIDVENRVTTLIENEELNSLTSEELKKYIEYFKNKANFYTEKCSEIDKKIKELNNK